ncbi:MAG: hypothetical protein WAR79_14150 [Melioribacteraceae bacterium]
MFTQEEFNSLTSKYGKYGSWAIWDEKNERDTNIILDNYSLLNSKYVGVGLNISKSHEDNWGNFRGGKHDRKLKYAFNVSSLRGFYLTDLFKGLKEPKSNLIYKSVLSNKINLDYHINFFIDEMNDIKVNNETTFIIFGVVKSNLARIFCTYFKNLYKKNNIINCYHYSYYQISDKEWVTDVWNKLDQNLNYEIELKKYKL